MLQRASRPEDSDVCVSIINVAPVSSDQDDNEGKTKSCWHGYALSSRDDAPVFAQYAHILGGYRVNFSARLLVLSVFRIHNETGNIWSHLLGFGLCARIALASDGVGPFASVWAHHEYQLDRAICTLFFLSALACLAFSAAYHTLMCHSLAVHDRTYCLDLSGFGLLFR